MSAVVAVKPPAMCQTVSVVTPTSQGQILTAGLMLGVRVSIFIDMTCPKVRTTSPKINDSGRKQRLTAVNRSTRLTRTFRCRRWEMTLARVQWQVSVRMRKLPLATFFDLQMRRVSNSNGLMSSSSRLKSAISGCR
jgi:hypothetical protein